MPAGERRPRLQAGEAPRPEPAPPHAPGGPTTMQPEEFGANPMILPVRLTSAAC